MSDNNNELKPLSLDFLNDALNNDESSTPDTYTSNDKDDTFVPLSGNHKPEPINKLNVETNNEVPKKSNTYNNDDVFVPISGVHKPEIINKNSNFVCFFGSAYSGKSVILCSLLYYLKSREGVLSLDPSTPTFRESEILLSNFFEDIALGKLPARTTIDQISRFDLKFTPNNKSSKVIPINLAFLDTSGDNNTQIRKGGEFHSTITDYINAQVSITFIIATTYDNAHKEDTFINEFISKLEIKGTKLKKINIIIIVSKWDMSGKQTASNEELESFFQERLPITNTIIKTYNLTRTYYTIGDLDSSVNKITRLNLDRAEVLSKWLYKSITGYPLDYEGTFWERIKFSILNNE